MWITRSITTRLFVWLAAIAIPFQGLPSATCGCTPIVSASSEVSGPSEIGGSSKTSDLGPNCCSQPNAAQCSCTGAEVCRCGETSSCSNSKKSCCSGENTFDSECQSKTGCQCGDNCQCGKSSVPTEPVSLPVENNSLERIATGSITFASRSTVSQLSFSRQHRELDVGANTLTALGSCVALCRFTL